MILPTMEQGAGAPPLVLLHLFGSSKREWTECISLLAPRFRCIAMDLPGFGEAASIRGYGVEEMVQRVEATLRTMQLPRFVLIGHSMSGKVTLAIAARKFPHLCGIILVAPSPPSPEPISDESKVKMLAMKRDRTSADAFLDGITFQPLVGPVRERAVRDFVECAPDAWAAWLKHGSKEDWADRIGLVSCPALVVTGETDPSLSASVQEKTTMRHLDHARLETIRRCGHLPTMEAPDELSALIRDFAQLDLNLR